MNKEDFMNTQMDYYFSPRPYLQDIMFRHSISKVKIDGEWHEYTEVTDKGDSPVTDSVGMIKVGTARRRDAEHFDLTNQEIILRIEKWKKDYPHLAPK
jgi:hypothetical protein